MLVSYYGGYVRKSTLIDMTKTNKNGTTAYHLNDTLIKLGFDSRGVGVELDNIRRDNIILPCIASVIINNSYKHFVVIYEINFKKKYLIIGDPADKIKKITYAHFYKMFNKVLIISFPMKKIQIDKKISPIKFINHLIKPQRKSLLNIFILSIFITLFSIATSFYTEYMINGINSFSKRHLLFIFGIFFSIYMLKTLTDFFRNKLLIFINQKIDLSLTLDIYNKIILLPYNYYRNRTTGDILSRINDLDNIRDMIGKVSLSLFVDLPLTILSLIVLYITNKTLFSIGILILLLYLVIIIIFKNIFKEYISKIQYERGCSTSYMVESISGFETVKGTHLEESVISRFQKKYIKMIEDIFNYQNLYFLQNLFKEIIDNIGFITIIFAGCLLVINNKMSIGALFTFSSLLIYFLEPIKNIISLDNTLKEAKNALNRILELILNDDDNGIVDKFNNGDIEFKNLNFTFNDRDEILKNVNIYIKRNSKVMVIGKSGSGKSTLFKLLMKYYKISNNNIFIDNIDINNYKKAVIDSNVLYLNQNEILFNDTLYNNLIFGNSRKFDLLKISNICHLEKIIDSNVGYNMLIEENGFNLSGGEKQRIVLARTLLRDFNILIIDEGLNQIDIDLERDILKNIFKYFENKTIIVISHRLDNRDLFDNLIEIEDGILKENKLING